MLNSVCIYVCVCMHVYVCMYVCLYVCMHACRYVYSGWSNCVHAPSWWLPASKFPVGLMTIFSSFAYVEENTTIKTNKSGLYRAFSLTRPASMLIYWRKRKCLHKERIQLPKDFVDTPTGLRFIVLKHQHGRRTSCKNAQNFKCTEPRLRQADLQSWTLRSHHYHLI